MDDEGNRGKQNRWNIQQRHRTIHSVAVAELKQYLQDRNNNVKNKFFYRTSGHLFSTVTKSAAIIFGIIDIIR